MNRSQWNFVRIYNMILTAPFVFVTTGSFSNRDILPLEISQKMGLIVKIVINELLEDQITNRVIVSRSVWIL